MPRLDLKPGAPRLSALTFLQTLVGLTIVIAYVDFDLSSVSWWQVAVYATVTYGAAVFYDVSENRRILSNMEGLLFLPALFLLSPTEVIIGRVAGGYFGDRDKIGTGYKIRFNSSTQLMVIATIVAVFETLFPNRDLATVTTGQVALAGFVVLGLYEAFVPVWTTTFSLGNFGRVNRRIFRDSRVTQIGIVVEFSVGMLLVMAMATSAWMFVPIVAIAGLIIHMGLRSARHWVLSAGMDHIVALTRSASSTSDPNETFASVRSSVKKLGAIEDVVIVHVDQGDNLSFDPAPGLIIAREITSGLRLRELARVGSLSIAAIGSRAGALGVWRLSETTEDYLVTYSDRRMISLRNFWQAVDILSQHAAVVHTTTSQRRALELQAVEAHKKARIDEATGRPNRLSALEWLEVALTREERLVIIGIRIHGLDALQQVLGEQTADADLRDFVEQNLDAHGFDFVARVREEVFVLMKSGMVEEAVHVAECIVSSDDHQSDSVKAVAAGVVYVPPNTSADPHSLLSDCWIALARAERDEVKVANFDELDAKAARRRFAIAQALPEAIDQGHIFPVFHPQIDIGGDDLLGCEVLARWIHPELGFVSPVEFIEIAEQRNLIEPLTKLIFSGACGARERWKALGLDIRFSVNVSARSLLQHSFVKHIAELFMAADLREGELTIEIAESTIAKDDATTTTALELLRTFGATISIDDFGIGYSALAYLHRLPVDEVKIDKSMVMTLGQEHDPTNVVAGLIEICHALGIRVVAEGVETNDTLRRLHALGCDVAQGYVFAEPMEEREWCEWASKRLRVPTPPSVPVHIVEDQHGQ